MQDGHGETHRFLRTNPRGLSVIPGRCKASSYDVQLHVHLTARRARYRKQSR